MPNYYVNEAVFTLPDKGFVDRTLHRLESKLTGDEAMGLEIRRVPLEPGKSLRQLVDAEVAATKTTVSGFTIVEDVELAMDGAPAIVLRARLRALDMPYYQRQAHVALEKTWLSFIVTAPFAERATCDQTFERIVHSLEWRRD
jgi:hypothetical protein